MSFGRFDSGQTAKPFSDINVTPLVDVMLVLVVVFLVTAPLLASAVKVDLPKAAGKSLDGSKHLALTIAPDGRIYLNDQFIDSQALAQTLADAAQRYPDTEVQLRADAAVPYGRVVEAMGLAQKAGLRRLAFVAQAEKP